MCGSRFPENGTEKLDVGGTFFLSGCQIWITYKLGLYPLYNIGGAGDYRYQCLGFERFDK